MPSDRGGARQPSDPADGAPSGETGNGEPYTRPSNPRRLWDALKLLVQPEPVPGESDRISRFRGRLALGIVALSILAATAIWRASVYDERASQRDALFREQLVTHQQLERQNEEVVAQDIALFGSYEEHAFRAHQLKRDAEDRRTSPELASRLRIEAQGERRLAAADRAGFQAALPGTSAARPSYDPAQAYVASVKANTEFERVRPQTLREDAREKHKKGVHLTGVAALFVAALVLFTFAEVSLGRRLRVRRGGLRGARLLSVAGSATALVAIVLLVLILASGGG